MSTKHDNRPELENPPKDDLAGLRNAVRLVWFAADRRKTGAGRQGWPVRAVWVAD